MKRKEGEERKKGKRGKCVGVWKHGEEVSVFAKSIFQLEETFLYGHVMTRNSESAFCPSN